MEEEKMRCRCALSAFGLNYELNSSAQLIEKGDIPQAEKALDRAKTEFAEAKESCGLEFKQTEKHIENAERYLREDKPRLARDQILAAISELTTDIVECAE